MLLIISSVFGVAATRAKSDQLSVAFLDVGQGDAILISQGNTQVLIDGGPSGTKLLEKLGERIPFWDREIEAVIATHPDADHISGLVDVLKNYTVDELIESGVKSESQVFAALEQAAQDKHVAQELGRRGMVIKLSDDAQMEILSPTDDLIGGLKKDDTNSASVVARLTYGDNSFLFTGDLPTTVEGQLIQTDLPLRSEVLKVSHHGSKYATSKEFLDRVAPEQAVVSVGKDNRYGHPAAETLSRLTAKNVPILRTDQLGDVVYDCPDAGRECVLQQ